MQYSVFGIKVDPAQWVAFKAQLEAVINREMDSLRYYYLGTSGQRRVEHVGAKPGVDFGSPLMV